MNEEGRACKFEFRYARCLRQSIHFQFLAECATVHWLYPMVSSMSNHEPFSVSLAGRLYRRFRALSSKSVRIHVGELMNDVFKKLSNHLCHCYDRMGRSGFGGSARND